MNPRFGKFFRYDEFGTISMLIGPAPDPVLNGDDCWIAMVLFDQEDSGGFQWDRGYIITVNTDETDITEITDEDL